MIINEWSHPLDDLHDGIDNVVGRRVFEVEVNVIDVLAVTFTTFDAQPLDRRPKSHFDRLITLKSQSEDLDDLLGVLGRRLGGKLTGTRNPGTSSKASVSSAPKPSLGDKLPSPLPGV